MVLTRRRFVPHFPRTSRLARFAHVPRGFRFLPAVALVSLALGGTAHAEAPAADPVAMLQSFIQTNTVNPPGNESSLTRPLAERFRAEGMQVELAGATPKRQNLIVTLPAHGAPKDAQGTKPWLVIAHVDTVHADAAGWTHPPFAGRLTDGEIWGRGALDNKGMAAALATSLIRLHRSGMRPTVPLIAIFAVDEETGSDLGVKWLLEQRPALFDVAGVLNEGGFTIVDPAGPAAKTYYVSVGEKGIAWLRVRAAGTPGHGSIRWGNNANEKLLRALTRLAEWKHPRADDSPLAEFAMADLRRQGKPARSTREALQKHPLGKQVERDPALRSSLENTCNVTVLKAGEKPNVIPGTSEAVLDCRIVPGRTPDDFLAEARRRIDDAEVNVELLVSSIPNVNPWSTPFFEALEAQARKHDPRALVVPVLSAGATDSRFWRDRGVNAYGIIPIPIAPDLVQGMHGLNERIPVAGLHESTTFLTGLLTELCKFR